MEGGPINSYQTWRRDPQLLQRWKEGRLGVPLVDANMRELAATGFMSNRGRQNVASYLALDLGLDWRDGAVRRSGGLEPQDTTEVGSRPAPHLSRPRHTDARSSRWRRRTTSSRCS